MRVRIAEPPRAKSSLASCPTGQDSLWGRLLVNSGVQPLYQLLHRNFQDFAKPEHGGGGNGPACLNLLKMPSREAERNHVFLAVSVLFAKRAHFGTESAEEFLLIRHALVCSVVRAETPRAE